ncbi:MAG: diguanylate cyclase [Candidatus Stahlbacteria bacterium]|nr:MAG: diguanylate cyclase [Candidatus Stahlbacteria bacterium]
MGGRNILKLLTFLPFFVYAYFSFTGQLLLQVNPLYLIALPVAAALVLLLSRNLWLFIASLVATNAAVQLTGGSGSQLFFFYFLLLFVEGLRTSSWRYFFAVGAIVTLEAGSALFHLKDTPFPFGPLAAFVGFAALAYLFLRREERHRQALEQSLDRERAKYHWLDPLVSPRSQRLAALKEETYSVDADVLYKGFVNLGFETLNVHTAALFLISGNRLHLVAARSHSDRIKDDVSFELGEGLISYLAREQKPSLLNDLGADMDRLGYYTGKVEVNSILTVPIKSGETNYGILVADARRMFTEYDQTFLVRLGSLLARDIQIARAYEERHREALRFSGLYELAGNLLTGLSEEGLIDRSFELVRDLFAPDAIGFARLREKEGAKVLRYEGTNGFDKGFRFDPERSLVAMTAKHKGFLKQRDMTKPGLYRLGPGEKPAVNKTFLGIGFEEDEETHGVLWLEKQEADAYSGREGKILGFTAALLSAAFLRVRYHEELARLARLDGLTGLLNHRAFQEELIECLKKSGTVAVFIIDIDHFKRINDTYGHPVGDMVLAKIAEVIKDKGIAARYGGEEFALIIPNIPSRQMIGRGQEILAAIRRAMVRIPEGTIQVTASVGGAIYSKDARTREDLVRAADSALYAAKTGGRNRLVLAGK